jgi:hypothetical protein
MWHDERVVVRSLVKNTSDDAEGSDGWELYPPTDTGDLHELHQVARAPVA